MSILERLQADVAGTCEADEYAVDIPIFIFRPRVDATGAVISAPEIEGAINGALAGLTAKGGKKGAAVTVLMPTVEGEHPNVPGPKLRAIVSLLCEEITIVNMDATTGTRKSAEDLAIYFARLLHLRNFAPLGTLSAERDTMKPTLEAASGKVTYEVRLGCDVPLAALDKVITPTIANAGTLVTLTCATAGASIYYTTDGSLPRHAGTIGGAGATASTLYAAPFNTSVGSNVRAAAYKTGLAPSNPAQRTTT